MSKQIMTPVFRVSHPSLYVKNTYNNKEAWEITCIIPKDFDTAGHPPYPGGDNKKMMAALEKAIDDVGRASFGKDWPTVKERQYAYPIRDGSERAKEGYGPEVVFFRAKCTKNRPGVVDRKRQPIYENDENGMYAGCYAVATVSVYSYDNQSRGVAIGLKNVQKIADGDIFGSRTTPEDDFEEWDDDDEDLLR